MQSVLVDELGGERSLKRKARGASVGLGIGWGRGMGGEVEEDVGEGSTMDIEDD
jgi:hypothetical protein